MNHILVNFHPHNLFARNGGNTHRGWVILVVVNGDGCCGERTKLASTTTINSGFTVSPNIAILFAILAIVGNVFNLWIPMFLKDMLVERVPWATITGSTVLKIWVQKAFMSVRLSIVNGGMV